MAAKERWVGVEDVALHLDVNKDSIYHWIAKMGLPAHRDSDQEIFRGLRVHIHSIIEDFSSARFFVAVASGTPHMHAC